MLFERGAHLIKFVINWAVNVENMNSEIKANNIVWNLAVVYYEAVSKPPFISVTRMLLFSLFGAIPIRTLYHTPKKLDVMFTCTNRGVFFQEAPLEMFHNNQ